jgi:5-methylthioadenosine/S-adenosylhomocysteine deaminase
MSKDKRPSESPRAHHDNDGHEHDHDHDAPGTGGLSRREILGSTAAGAAVGAVAATGLGKALADPPPHAGTQGPPPHAGTQGPPPHAEGPGKGQKILLKGGVVLTMDPDTPDMEEGDVLIEGSKIVDIGHDLGGGGHVIDCKGKIVMPGFINTHHHQYETVQRSVISDGLLGSFAPGAANWPQENYVSVVQQIWTAGLIPGVWDLGRSPYDPEDCYISELVASWAGINSGVTTAIDTSQSSHTPEHTDAMIEGLMASGRRTVYDYSSGRSDQPGYEFPGSSGNTTSGIGRIATTYFNSDDQLVTLGAQFQAVDLWPLAREYGAPMIVHGGTADLVAGASNPAGPQPGPDQTFIHLTGTPPPGAWEAIVDYGCHVSAACPIEMEMGHGTPVIQASLDRGILPSLSSDVDTDMTHDMFTQMRTAYTLQRLLANPNEPYQFAGSDRVNCRTVLRMATVAGAACAGLSDKVGMLKVGMEADIITLNARTIDTAPMINAPGTVVTMMDRSHVCDVIIGGQIKKRDGKLVGANMEKLLQDIEQSQENILARIHAVPIPVDGLHSAPGYTPSLLSSCCLAEEPYPGLRP